MSSGGVFKLIANDGRADRMIMATELLNERIKDIMCLRAKQGMADPTPTLVDVERTHILYMNAHFKPFAAIGYEYNKTKANSGSSQLGTEITFSIPQYGDFFCDMCFHATLPTAQATAGTVPAFPTVVGNLDTVHSNANKQVSSQQVAQTGTGTTQVTTYVRYTYDYVDSAGNVLQPGAAATNFVRYCDNPGAKLMAKTRFEVNGNPLDEYTSDIYMFYQKCQIAPNKMVGWKRLIGQEVPKEAVTELTSIAGSSAFANVNRDVVDSNGNAAKSAPKSATNTSRQMTYILDGPQTPKIQQPILNVWVPLLFWFNRDCRISVPSVSIPYGQRFITINLAALTDLVYVAPGNLYRRLIQETYALQGDTTSGTTVYAIAGLMDSTISYERVLANGSVVDTSNTSSIFVELYINNIFVNSEIHDIYIKRIGFSLIRVYRQQRGQQLMSASDEIQLNQLKWPIETIYLGFQPVNNTAASNPNVNKDWCRLALNVDNVVDKVSKHQVRHIQDNTSIDGTNNVNFVQHSTSLDEKIIYPVVTETVDTIQVNAHGIIICQNTAASFYRDYTSYIYGGANLNTPEDLGAYIINFCIYPGSYQPSGHLNISRAREFYLLYQSSFITPSNPVTLIIVAIAINFLMITDGSALLRFTT
jgi:hypothetical protein